MISQGRTLQEDACPGALELVCKRYEEGSVMSVTTQAREISGHPNLAPEKLGHKDLVARAAALIPQLRERVAEAEQTRKLPALNVEAVRNAGLFRVLQAARYGGHQQSLRTHIDTIALVAELQLDRVVHGRHSCP